MHRGIRNAARHDFCPVGDGRGGDLRIIGLDPGLLHTGWGVIDIVGSNLIYVACGRIDPPTGDGLALRLKFLHEALYRILAQFRPGEAAVEETFLNRNPATTLKLGQARGVALLTPALLGLPVAEYSPRSIKQAVVGTGGAAKEQVAMMVATLLPGSRAESPDAADALATAICHGHRCGIDRIRQQAAQAR